mgnify:CR=1 FL=1
MSIFKKKEKPEKVNTASAFTVAKQKPRKQELIKIASFFVTLYLGTVLAFIIPLRPTYSDSEKRSLQEFPQLTFKSFYTGDYFDDLTLWFSDTFPFREGLTKANTF